MFTELGKEAINSLESMISLDEVGLLKVQEKNPEESFCSLCKRDYRVKDIIVQANTCRHAFHKDCLDAHIEQFISVDFSIDCPCCGKKL